VTVEGDVAVGSEVPAGRGWPRAAALFAVTLATSVVQPTVLVVVPFLLMVGLGGVRRVALVVASVLAMIVVVSGARDGMWYAERAWALLIGGWFVGLTLAVPRLRLSGKALGAVFGSASVAAVILAVRGGSWSTLDFAVTDGVRAAVARTLDAISLLRGGEALPAAIVANIYSTAEAQAEVFPALVCIASMAGLSVAWWAYARLSGVGDQAIGPVKNFRFNDHLVWLMISGLLLLVTRRGDALARIGANAVVFMGALYTLRGAGVVMFVTGGLSFLGYVLLSLGLLLAAPLAIGAVMMVGVGDTWLDIRSRLQKVTT
jgi:hypothetical protein